MSDADLDLFVQAQAAVRGQVTAELRAGRKTSHWIWFVFPQIDGLGRSETAQRFAIRDLDLARRYLHHPMLDAQLRSDVQTLLGHAGKSARDILGSPDDLKFRSCLTLFHAAATSPDDRKLFQSGLDLFYGGSADQRTLALLGRAPT